MFHETATGIRLNRVSAAMQLLRLVRLHRDVVIAHAIQHAPLRMIQLRDFQALPAQTIQTCVGNLVQKAKKTPYDKQRRPVKALRPKPAPGEVGILRVQPTHEGRVCNSEYAVPGPTLELAQDLMRTGLATTSGRLFMRLRSVHRHRRR